MTTWYDVGGVMRPRPFKTGRFGHLGLYVRDLGASVDFYHDLLGFRHTDDLTRPDVGPDPIGCFLTYNTDHHAMVLIDASVGKSRSDRYERGVTVNQMSFQVATLEEVVNAHEMLSREGKPIWRVGRDVPGSNWAVYFTDPDGHTVELFYGMEQIGWDRRSKPLSSFVAFRTYERPTLPQPSEYDEVIGVERSSSDVNDADAVDADLADVAGGGGGHRWSETRPATFDVGGVLLPRPFRVVNTGPISLFVEDLDAAVAFYRDELGLAVTEEVDYGGERIVFLRTGTEHHTVALLPRSLRNALGLDERTTLAAYGVQLATYRQLCDAASFLAAEGCTIVELPPELHSGIDYAVHVLDPDGHCVRLYYEMENVGTRGRPMTASERRPIAAQRPAVIAPNDRTSPNLSFQGPLG